MSLQPRTAEVVDLLEQSHRALVDVVMAWPAETREAPARDGAWSVAEHIEHLAIVEDGTGRLISKLIKAATTAGVPETDTASIIATMDRFEVSTARRPIAAPDQVRPTGTVRAVDALAQLSTARARVVDAFRRASGLALGGFTHPHPVLGPLNIYQWGVFLAQHEQRHLAHIRRVAETLH
jgi:hypothetical protein